MNPDIIRLLIYGEEGIDYIPLGESIDPSDNYQYICADEDYMPLYLMTDMLVDLPVAPAHYQGYSDDGLVGLYIDQPFAPYTEFSGSGFLYAPDDEMKEMGIPSDADFAKIKLLRMGDIPYDQTLDVLDELKMKGYQLFLDDVQRHYQAFFMQLNAD